LLLIKPFWASLSFILPTLSYRLFTLLFFGIAIIHLSGLIFLLSFLLYPIVFFSAIFWYCYYWLFLMIYFKPTAFLFIVIQFFLQAFICFFTTQNTKHKVNLHTKREKTIEELTFID